MVIASVILALVMVKIDEFIVYDELSGLDFLYLNQPDGARSLLSTVAGSMIGVAGVSFSITMVVLSLASSQFGPRLIRNFMRDKGNQIVLGTFIATFLYSLLVLRTVKSGEEVSFVPHLAIMVAVVLAILSLLVFIYFIHHTAESIQVANVIAGVSRDLMRVIEKTDTKNNLFLETLGHSKEMTSQVAIPEFLDGCSENIKSDRSGYLTAVAEKNLLDIAIEHDLIIKLMFKPGDFVTKGLTLAHVYPVENFSVELEKTLKDCFVLAIYKTHEQDVYFLFQQLTEVALRALSPGINDPYTAVMCLDRLGDGLKFLCERSVPNSYRYDSEHNLRIIAEKIDIVELTHMTLSPIRHYASGDLIVSVKMLQTIKMLEAFFSAELKPVLYELASETIQNAKAKLSKHDFELLSKQYRLIPNADQITMVRTKSKL